MVTAAAPPVLVTPGSAGPRAAVSTIALLAFLAVTAGGLAGIGGGLFPPVYVATAIGTALVAYYRAPTRFIPFVIALWFFTPFVRRVIDYHHGFQPANLVLVAPTAATLVSLLTAMYRARELRGTLLYPFLLTILGVLYGYFIGVLKVGLFPATYALLTWLGPISLSMHLILSWRMFPALRDSFLTFLQWTLPILGIYGIYQVVRFPEWDRYWMISAQMFSIGNPIRFGFRAFGTLNSPGPYSVALIIGILYLLGSARRGMVLTLSFAFVSLLLTRTRSAWVALVVGLFIIQFMGPLRRMARNWFFLLLMIGLALPVLSLNAFRDSISSRIASFALLGEDSSVRQRLMISTAATQAIGTRAEGEGLGATGGGTKLAAGAERLASIDNGFLEVFYVLGWPGGSLVLVGLIGQLLTLARFGDSRVDSFANSARACFWSLLSVLLIGDIFSGAVGAMFWSAYGFACCAHAYNYATGKGLRSRQLAHDFAQPRPATATAG